MSLFSLFPRNVGESAPAFASRHAAMQGWPSVEVFANRIGVGWGALVNCKDAATVADAFAEPVAGVAFDSGHWSASAVRLRGEILSRRHWSGSTPVRFCPSCLAEDAEAAPGHVHAAWLRTWWDVTAVAVCPDHLSPLADACGCGAAVRRQQPFGGRCPSCGARLADTPTSAPFGAAAVRGQLYVLGRLGASSPIACPILDRAPLQDVIQGLRAVGQDLALEGTFHLPMDRGFTAFEDWPRSFDSMLDRLSADTDGRKGRWGAIRAYGALHDFVRRATGDCLAVDLAKRTAAHADRKGISPGRTLYGVKCGGGGVASLAEVSRLTGLSYRKSRRLAARLAPGAPTGSGAPLSVDAEAAAELARLYPGSISLKPLAALLGMQRRAVGDLVKAGVLVPVVDGGGANRHHAFRPEDADRLVASLGAALDAFGGEVVSLPDACHRMQVPTADAVGLVLRGGVRGRLLPDAIGIKGVGVVPADLRPARTRASSTLADAARALGVKWECARDLVAAGLLEPDRDGQVPAAAVAAFKATYVAASEVAAAFGTSPKALVVRAAENGIVPVMDRPAFQKVFFLRADAERLVPEAVRRRTAVRRRERDRQNKP